MVTFICHNDIFVIRFYMQKFILFLVTIWTILFTFIFILLFPEAVHHAFPHQQKQSKTKIVENQEEEIDERSDEDAKPLPLRKGDPSPSLHIMKREMPDIKTPEELQQELDSKVQSALETRLIQILVKINVAMCDKCTRDDKRILLQLKMMQAFLDGNPKSALEYSEELDQYINRMKAIQQKPIKKPTQKPQKKAKLKPKYSPNSAIESNIDVNP